MGLILNMKNDAETELIDVFLHLLPVSLNFQAPCFLCFTTIVVWPLSWQTVQTALENSKLEITTSILQVQFKDRLLAEYDREASFHFI